MADDAIVITLPPGLDPAVRERILSALPPEQVSVAAVDGAAAPVGEAARAFDAALATLPRLGETLGQILSRLEALGPGLFLTLLVAVGAMGAGYAVELAARRLVPARPAERPDSFTGQLRLAALWLLGRLAGVALFAVVAGAIARAILPAEALAVSRAALGVVLTARVTYVLGEFFVAAQSPARRLAGLTDAEAGFVARMLLIAVTVGGVLRLMRELVLVAGPTPSGPLLAASMTMLSIVPIAAFYFIIRRPVAGLILKAFGATTAQTASPFARVLALNWHLFYAILAIFAALSKAAGDLGLERFQRAAESGNSSTLLAAVAPFALAGVSLWRDERLARTPLSAHSTIIGVAALLKGVLVVAAAVMILTIWGLDPLTPAPPESTGLAAIVPSLIRALFAVVVGVALWRAVSEGLTAYIEPPRDMSAPMDEDKLGGTVGSRLGTVLPVLRGFALALIGVVTVMFTLSTLGVNIAPLLAGAGVIGLAIGFGSQRLVNDVISGVFLLYEDAIRVGEYIETSGGKGVVEKISIRSVRLRHPRGAIYTVPFSAMGTVQNHSRDWVKMKFTFDVPQDTDLEKVRKLVKAVGAQLMEDPELKGRFLEPMKSQGAVAITGRAFSVGIKFVTRPGQQWLARRKAMAALQKAFKEHGIELMTPRIELGGAPAPAEVAQAIAAQAR